MLSLLFLGHVEVDSEAHSAVNKLAEECRIQTSIEASDSLLVVDLGKDESWRAVRSALRSQLDSGLEHVCRLDGGSGNHTGQAADRKVLHDLRHALFILYVYILLVHGY